MGVSAQIVGHGDIGASVDASVIDGPSGSAFALDEEYPPVGAEVDAVVQQIRRFHPPAWVRLTLRAADLVEFRWPCDLCGRPTTLSPGGDGVVMDVRSADGPGSTAPVAHRTCLADLLIHNPGEQARVLHLGRGE
jgi:hypothetical protein